MIGGELFVTGRLKDVIIIGGHNFYAHDLEDAVSTVLFFFALMRVITISCSFFLLQVMDSSPKEVRPGRVVAFSYEVNTPIL